MSLNIRINDPMPLDDKSDIQSFINNVCKEKNISSGDLEFTFLSDADIHQINKKHLNHDYPTDTITFNLGTQDHIEADIYISLETAKENAETYGSNFITELKLYIIHCILHCCGYDDQDPIDKKRMDDEQQRLLGQNL